MARLSKRIVSTVLSVALVILSIGLDAQCAAAQTFTGRVVPVSPAPQIGLGLANAPMPSLALPALSLTAPSLLAASLLVVAPAAIVALKPVTPAGAIAESIKAAVPALQSLAKPETSGSAVSAAGRDLEDILTGARSARSASESDAVSGVASVLTPTLSAPSASSAAPETPVPAAAPAPFKSIASASSYSVHRLALKAVAALTGAVFTLPQAGPALTAKIIASAADKTLVLSDFDDTLAAYNEVLPADKIEAIRKIKAAGKHFAVISDRGDSKRPSSTQLTVFESLESIPLEVRAGMYVAANSGGKVYRYDAQGVPQKVHEAEPLAAKKLAHVQAAAAATKARLAEVGAEQHVEDAKNPAESYNTYGYAMMLKPGSSEASVRGAAAILAEELASRGVEADVNPRFAKDPANPPYITFSIITKADAAAYIAKAVGVDAENALVIGDAMFVPREAKKAGWLSRLGEKLSGRPQAKAGNETDRNMTKLLPGVLALGVGATMDPRVPNGWALAGHGPVLTQKVLESVASKARKTGTGGDADRTGTALQVGLIAAIVAMGAFGWYAFYHALAEIVSMGEQALREGMRMPAEFFLGGAALGMFGRLKDTAVKAAPALSALKSFLLWLVAAGAVAALYGAFYWAATHAPAAVPQGVPDDWQGPIPSIDDIIRGMGGILGLGALAGTLKGAQKVTLSDDDIRASALSVVASKGGVWSQTEYNMGYYTTLDSLKSRGATAAQLELFKKLCDEAPVKGGRFSPWSGD